MQVKLAGWTSRGLRCPDVDIDLSGKDGTPARVALIQMPNGTGKTTTLDLIRASLTGEATEWTPEFIRELRRPGDKHEQGQFRINLQMDGKPLTFELSLDFVSGVASYTTTRPGSGGIVHRHEPPSSIIKFLTPSFLDLFIFNGEFADELLKKGVGRADEAVSALCQLDLTDTVRDVGNNHWQQMTSKGGPKTASALEKLKKQRAELTKLKLDLTTARENATSRLASGKLRYDELTKLINDRIGSVEATQEKSVAAQLALHDANYEVARASSDLFALIRMPLALNLQFSESLIELKDNLDDLRLPENTSAQFFEDLLSKKECICGREMNDFARVEIANRSKGYLDSDEAGEINALKRDINLFVGAPGENEKHIQLTRAAELLTKAKRSQREAQQTLNALAKQLEEAGDNELKAWRAELVNIEDQIAKCQLALDDIDAPAESEGAKMMSLKFITRELSQVSKQIAELTDTVDLKEKIDVLDRILSMSEILARDAIRRDLLKSSNERLEVVLANDPLRIERIDRSLHLENQSGASMGQKLSVGYAFLMSALSRGGNDFPLVVDSPAGPMDEGVRRNVGKLIPELCTQFVGFTINTERPGFVQALERATDDCLFLTFFRRTEGTQRLTVNLPASGVMQTDTGILVNDRDYFMNFDVTEEEDF